MGIASLDCTANGCANNSAAAGRRERDRWLPTPRTTTHFRHFFKGHLFKGRLSSHPLTIASACWLAEISFSLHPSVAFTVLWAHIGCPSTQNVHHV